MPSSSDPPSSRPSSDSSESEPSTHPPSSSLTTSVVLPSSTSRARPELTSGRSAFTSVSSLVSEVTCRSSGEFDREPWERTTTRSLCTTSLTLSGFTTTPETVSPPPPPFFFFFARVLLACCHVSFCYPFFSSSLRGTVADIVLSRVVPSQSPTSDASSDLSSRSSLVTRGSSSRTRPSTPSATAQSS